MFVETIIHPATVEGVGFGNAPVNVVEEAKQIAENDMGVTFIDVDISEFSNKVSNVQQEMLDANPDIQDLYDHIQAINAEYEEGSAQ